MAIDKIFDGAVDGIADNLFNSVSNSVSEIKAMQQRKAAENVQLVVQALKKIDADIREKYDGVTETFDKRISNIKDGQDGKDGKNGLDGVNGKDGRDGKDGRNGRDGLTGPRGFDGPKGIDGKDGRDGEDGVSVTDAHIDFDGSLIISLSSGRVINVGEVVAADIAEKIKVITNGGGTSQPVLDKLASLQEQIDLIASALVYKGTWNASTNTPALASSVGTANSFYIVSVAGTTNLNGTSNWGVGDWAVFNGSVWQRVEGGAVGNFTDLTVSGTTTLSNLTASTALALNASKEVVSVTNTGTGNNVLATSPTLVTPALGTPSSATLTNATGLPLSSGVTGTLPILNGGTGQTTANAAFNALAPSQASNSGKYLTTNGTDTSWATLSGVGTVTSVSGTGTVNGLTLTGTVTTSGSLTLGGTLSGISNSSLTNSSITINGTATSLGGSINVGTVTSVGATVPSFLSITGSPITSSGTLAIGLSGTALPTTSGGTGLTSFTANGVVYASSSSALATGSALTFDGSKLVNTGYNKSTYQVSTGAVSTFESVGAAYLTYDGATGASVYSRSDATTENTLTFRASTFSFKVAGTQVASLNSSTFSLYNTPILLSGTTSGYTGFAAPATSNFTIYTLPSSDGTSGQSLTTNGSGTLSWASGTGGTVTSVSGTGTVSGISLSGTVTSSGSLTLGGALDLSAYSGAGAFTTLSASSTVTLSGGTANGVLYLNGSKVVTSGSALTFDGTTLGVSNGSAGSAGISITGTYSGSGTVAFLNFQRAGGAVAGTLGYNDASTAIQFGTTTNHSTIFLQNNAEAMRLTSTGLGIGTSSPSYKLDVNGNAQIGNATAATNRSLFINGVANKAGRIIFQESGVDKWYIGNGAASENGNFEIYNANGNNTVLTPAGNLGLGVTPSAWEAGWTPIQGIGYSLANGNAVQLQLGSNWYNDGTSKYRGTGAAAVYQQSSGSHSWLTAPSGTAGNAITFTQAMTLDASGRLGVGTTSPSSYGGWISVDIRGSNGGQLIVANSAATNIGEIFTDSNGFNVSARTNNAMLFKTNDAERARIDSSGNLLVGTTSGSHHYIKKASAGSGSAVLYIQGADEIARFAGVTSASNPNAAATAFWIRQDGTTGRSINASGTINAAGADYAEYMTKSGNFTVAKGDVVGIDSQGKLTNVFANAVSFVVKSTDPSYVGGDTWGIDFDDDAEGLEAARQTVDRIAFAGQVPVNVLGATAGQYIIPVNDNGAIKGQAVSNPTFEQYQSSVGKVIAIEADGRARIIVKVA